MDDVWYLSHNLDVWLAHVDADTHYETYGWREGRDPNAYFQTREYLAENAESRRPVSTRWSITPSTASRRARSPATTSRRKSYISVNGDVKAAARTPSTTISSTGSPRGVRYWKARAGRALRELRCSFYLDLNDDVAAAAARVGPNGIVASEYAFRHYLEYGPRRDAHRTRCSIPPPTSRPIRTWRPPA